MYSEECLGENPEGFPTQRAALEEEDQLRWVGGISSHALFLPQCDSLVQVLRATLNAVCMWDEGVFPQVDCFSFYSGLILFWSFLCELRSGVVGG